MDQTGGKIHATTLSPKPICISTKGSSMGLIEKLMGFVFRGGVQSNVEVFRENSKKSAVRAHVPQQASLTQFATEFCNPRSGFDRFIDEVNRLPRPAMAFGVLGLCIAAMVDPICLLIAWRAYRLCLNPYGGYSARLCPFILERVIKAKALKYAPKTCKHRPKSSHKPFNQAQ
jgi:hypothetical protein